MDDQLFGHAAYNGPDRRAQLDGLVATVLEQGGLFMADMHEYVFDPVPFPEWPETYRDLFARLTQRGDVQLSRPVDVARHWLDRQAAIDKASQAHS